MENLCISHPGIFNYPLGMSVTNVMAICLCFFLHLYVCITYLVAVDLVSVVQKLHDFSSLLLYSSALCPRAFVAPGLKLAYIAGLVAFVYGLKPLTDPSLLS